MATNHNKTDGWTSTMRWIARILGLVAVGLFVAFLVISGTQVLPALTLTDPQGLPLMMVVLLTLAGVLVAWRWELVGGAMAIAGSIAIMALVCAGSGTDMLLCAALFTLPLWVAGALYLACCARVGLSPGREAT